MKKTLLLLALLTALGFRSQAQWVTIPDPNFVTWLNQNGYGTCMSGNQMDTTCPALVNADTVIILSGTIMTDLTGIQYFDNLKYLDCRSNDLTSLPNLPAGLVELHANRNPFTSLPALPSTLTYLDLQYGGVLTSLPALPPMLNFLSVEYNALTSLPSLPNGLDYLDCTGNQLTTLPALPNSLTQFYCSYNQLTSIPALPTNLIMAYGGYNQLTSLPTLPRYCDVNFSNNPITSLSEFPDSMFALNISNTLITCLPPLKTIQNLFFSNTNITCKPNIGNVTNSTPSLASLPLCQPGTPCALPNYVSIPDTNFGTWLNTNGYSSCLIGNNQAGWLMDTTCSAVMNADTISCSMSSISDLTGIQYFDNLKYLDCFNNQMTTLSALPKSLSALLCSGNQLTTLPPLPNSLTYLECLINNLSSLPPLPNSLTTINCSENQLTSLPALPNSLIILSCYDNQLTSLPTLPVSLSTLWCWQNQLLSLPGLPNSLINLDCRQNLLTSLPDLPNSLFWLYCSDNQLNSLPALSSTLTSLVTFNNQLSSIPELPDSLNYLLINDNPITCLPQLKRIVNLDFSNTQITCKSNYGNVTNSTPSLASLPLCQPGNVNGCATDSNCIGFKVDSISKIDASCIGSADGSITIHLSGGTTPYSYSLDGQLPQLSNTYSNLAIGTYSITATDANNCSANSSVSVLPRTTLSLTFTKTNVTCNGGNDGSICANIAGGVTPYLYVWSNNATTQCITALTAGNYNVTITESGSFCSAAATVVITQPTALSATITPVNVSCNGSNNGSACVNVTGGSSPYIYSWSNGATTQCISSLSAGPKTVTVVDAPFCTVTATVNISQPPVLNVSIIDNGNGTLSVVASGGCSPYTYQWYDGNTTTQAVVTGAGTYSVTITDACLCTRIDSITITAGNLLADAGPHDTICSNNSVTLGGVPTASGGTGPYTYSWSGTSLSCTNCPNPVAGPLAPGTYNFNVTVTDNVGASAVDGITILVDPSPVVSAGAPITICTITQITLGGSPTANGGTPGYTYAWSGGAAPIPNPTVTPASSTTYCVTITDSKNCTATGCQSVTVTNLVIDSVRATDVSCFGANDGAVCVYVSGGGLPYTYTWSNVSVTVPCASGGLQAGTYSVTIVDATGCSISASATIIEPAPFQIDATINIDSICPGQQVQLNAEVTSCGPSASCSGPISIGQIGTDTLMAPGNFTQTPALLGNFYKSYRNQILFRATELSSILGNATTIDSIAFKTQQFNSNAILQNYIIKIGCTSEDSLTQWNNTLTQVFSRSNISPRFNWNTFKLDQSFHWDGVSNLIVEVCIYCPITFGNMTNPVASSFTNFPSYLYSFGSTDLCGNDTIIGVSDLRPNIKFSYCSPNLNNYHYSWLPSSGPNSVVDDTLQNTSANPVSETTYQVTATDLNGCSTTDSVTISVLPGLQIDSITTTNVSCFGGSDGSACVYVSGGLSPYTYVWSNTSATVPCTSGGAGTYSVTITDAASCSITASATITQPAQIQASSSVSPVSCFGTSDGFACIIPSGGTSPYMYLWNTTPPVALQCATGLAAGNYSPTISDNNGCSTVANVIISGPGQFSVQVTSATSGVLPDTLCATVTGGTPPYLYNWSGNVNGLPNLCFELLSGVFSVTVTDSSGCSATFSTNSLCPNNCVWPGDADYNGIADNNDLLPIGLAYGKTGPARTQQDINWYAHVAQDWIDTITTTGSGSTGNNIITVASSAGISLGMAVSGTGITAGAVVTSLAGTTLGLSKANSGAVSGTLTFTTPSISSGVNSKHIDCDGNGTINADDTTAIIQNFGLLHAKTEDERGWRMTDPGFYVELDPDTTQAGDTLYANLTLGDVNVPATDVYGLAFTLNYDAAVVDTTKTKITFGNSWFGTATDKISIAKDFSSNGQLKCALTRIDHTTRSGFGPIGQAQFVITTDNINGKDLAYYQMNVWISDLVMIDNLGNYITVNQSRDSSLVEFEPVGIADIGLRNADLKIQPNPANDEVQILVTEELVGGELKVMDVEGRILMQSGIQTQNSKLKTQNLSQGIYFIKATTEKGTLTKRLVIAR